MSVGNIESKHLNIVNMYCMSTGHHSKHGVLSITVSCLSVEDTAVVDCELMWLAVNTRLTSTVHSKIPWWTWHTLAIYTDSICTRWVAGFWGEQRRREILQNRLYSPPCSTADEAGIASNVSCTVGDIV